MAISDSTGRRDFLKTAGAVGAALGWAGPAFAQTGRVIGANDRINIGVIGCGGRGRSDAGNFAEFGKAHNNSCQIAAVSDVYEKRLRGEAQKYGVKGYQDYRELLAQRDLDAVIVATPDHWHTKIAMDAMDQGKDVYLEKPMTHTNEEARQLVEKVKKTGRILQVGSQTTSADMWSKAKKAIADGMIGQMIMSQGSYHRNSTDGEWNWPIEMDASPDATGENFVNWNMWLGSQFGLAPERAWDPDRFFRFRKYWDYSLGIASDLFYHVIAPLNICWDEPQFPTKVTATGGIYVFKKLPDGKTDREVPDTFHLMADYAKGHSMILSSSMANSQHIPGMIRGHEGTITMVSHGQFERMVPFITVKPEVRSSRGQAQAIGGEAYASKFGLKEIQIPVDQRDMMEAHIDNFLSCMRTRQKPRLDVETGAKAVVVINLAAQSYREGRTMYWDEKNWKASYTPITA